MCRRTPGQGDAGFTVVEVIVAITIAGFVFLLGVLLGILAMVRPAAAPFGAAEMLLSVGLIIVASIVATGGLLLNAVNVRVRELHSALMRLDRRR